MHALRPSTVAVRSVTKRYGETLAVDRATLELQPGRITCLLGPSGCGKSTLLRIIAGLERADEGEIEAGGRLLLGRGANVPPERRRIGFVFQDFALFPHLTALQNVTFGLKGEPAAEARARATELLERFRLSARASAWPHSLSGGEQQRVAIARALAPRPTALLLDEPFSGLDGDLRSQVRDAVLAGLRDTEAAVLVVTHDPEEAMLLGDEVLLMTEGRIVQSGTPEECYFRPNSVAAARLLGLGRPRAMRLRRASGRRTDGGTGYGAAAPRGPAPGAGRGRRRSPGGPLRRSLVRGAFACRWPGGDHARDRPSARAGRCRQGRGGAPPRGSRVIAGSAALRLSGR